MKSSLKVTQAGLVALAGNIATALVALVPSWSSEHQAIAALLGAGVSNGFMLVNLGHKAVELVRELAASRPSADVFRVDALKSLEAEVQHLDLNTLAKDAIAGNLGTVVRDELQKILNPSAPAPVVVPADPAVPPAV